MTFFRQLRVLIWKNLLLRSRQRLRACIEILAPALLVTLLVLMRLRDGPQHIHECHFDQKPMPSAGLLPFLQGFVCSFNNTCKARSSETNFARLDQYNDSLISEVVNNIEDMLGEVEFQSALSQVLEYSSELFKLFMKKDDIFQIQPDKYRDAESSSDVAKDLLIKTLFKPHVNAAYLYEILKNIGYRGDINMVQEALNSPIADKIIIRIAIEKLTRGKESFCAKDSLTYFVKLNNTQTAAKHTEAMCGVLPVELMAAIAPEMDIGTIFTSLRLGGPGALVMGYEDLLEPVQKILEAAKGLQSIKDLINNIWSKANSSSILKTAGRLFCGSNANIFDVESEKKESMMQRMRRQFNGNGAVINARPVITREWDESMTPFCNDVFDYLENKANVWIRIMWKPAKPFILGKILYTPDTPATRRIISRMNQTIVNMGNMVWSGRQLLRSSPNLITLMEEIVNMYDNMSRSYDDAGFSNSPYNFFSKQTVLGYPIDLLDSEPLMKKDIDKMKSLLRYTRKVYNGAMNVTKWLECFDFEKFQPVKNEHDLTATGMDLLLNNTFWGGIVFENLPSDQTNDSLPNHIRYKLRFDIDKSDTTFYTQDRYFRRHPRRDPANDMKYWSFGWVHLQEGIENAIISEQNGWNKEQELQHLPSKFLQQFPYPCYIQDDFVTQVSRNLPIMVTIGLIYSCAMLVKSIVLEKEKRLKEFMKMMGVSSSVISLSWFIEAMVMLISSAFILTCVVKYGNVLMHSQFSLLLVFFASVCVCTIAQSFLMSVFFSQANIAAACSSVLFFVSYIPYPILLLWETQLSTTSKIVTSLFPLVSMGWGINTFTRFEEQGIGARWSNVWQSPLLKDDYFFGYSIIMLWVDSVICFVLAWYFEAVFPGQYGVPLKWYFPVTMKYWFGNSKEPYDDEYAYRSVKTNAEPCPDVEPENRADKPTVEIHHLEKIYENGKVALDDLSLSVYEGITSLLGHNGAGKTTTFSILCGLFRPTSGVARIYGYDIRKNMQSIRKSLGFCPQHNVLYDLLTVEEHLIFYSSLKESNDKKVKREVREMISSIGLPHKAKELSVNLSGGMQRKLSVGVAFTGNAKCILLDEPTAGVDPWARRGIWNLLLKLKAGRTIIMSTHFHSEADTISDKIAVVADGRMVCYGSPVFLKSRFGVGYHLTIVKSPSAWPSGAAQCAQALNKIVQFVRRYVKHADFVESVGSEIHIRLPYGKLNEQNNNNNSSNVSTAECGKTNFGALFDALDKNLAALHAETYGVRDTSLEEVFLRVMEQHYEKDGSLDNDGFVARARTRLASWGILPSEGAEHERLDEHNEVIEGGVTNQARSTNSESSDIYKSKESICADKLLINSRVDTPYQRLDGVSLILQQIKASLIKRFHHVRRSKKGFFCEMILPVVFVCLAMIIALMTPPVQEQPALELSPWLYGDPNYVFFAQNGRFDKATEDVLFEMSDRSTPQLGTRCVDNYKLDNGMTCRAELRNSKEAFLEFISAKAWNESVKCDCSYGVQQCPANAGGPHPPCVELKTTDFLCNATQRNLSDWLVKTNDEYEYHRYGGYSFGRVDYLEAYRNSNLVTIGGAIYNDALNGNIDERMKSKLREFLQFMEGALVQDNIKVWFNNRGWASSPAYLNSLSNVLLRSKLRESGKVSDVNSYGISVVNHPLNRTQAQLQDVIVRKQAQAMLHAVCVIFAMSFIPASFVMFIIQDHRSGSKTLQLSSKIRPWLYWCAQFLWDYGAYLFTAAICVFIFVAFQQEQYIGPRALPTLVLLLFLYGFAAIPLMYLTTWWFHIPSTAFVVLSTANLVVGLLTTMSVFILEIMEDEALRSAGAILQNMFLLLPHYCLGRGLMDLAATQVKVEVLLRFGEIYDPNMLAWGMCGRNILALLLQGVFFFVLTILCQYRFFRKPKNYKKNREIEDYPQDDDQDVTLERHRILSGNTSNSVLRCEKLTKFYSKKRHETCLSRFNPFGCFRKCCRNNGKKSHSRMTHERERQRPAVDNLTFGVDRAECFGLLGVNGAGKTTTFKILTGSTPPSAGNAYICNKDVVKNLNRARRKLGYCPQFDGLDSLVTGREHLEFYARINGVPETQVESEVDGVIKRLALQSYESRTAGTYSGGNKRKLSTGIAMVGSPDLLLFDEPSSGMDPRARRFLWDAILNCVKEGRSVALTSHSLEECENLCTRMAIMVNGRFKCIGSLQHLKSRFGFGYTVSMRVKSVAHVAGVCVFLERTFPNAVQQEINHNMVKYRIELSKAHEVHAASHTSLASLFNVIEKNKERLHITDASVNQTSLEDIFIEFAKQQNELVEDEQLANAVACDNSNKDAAGGLRKIKRVHEVVIDEQEELEEMEKINVQLDNTAHLGEKACISSPYAMEKAALVNAAYRDTATNESVVVVADIHKKPVACSKVALDVCNSELEKRYLSEESDEDDDSYYSDDNNQHSASLLRHSSRTVPSTGTSIAEDVLHAVLAPAPPTEAAYNSLKRRESDTPTPPASPVNDLRTCEQQQQAAPDSVKDESEEVSGRVSSASSTSNLPSFRSRFTQAASSIRYHPSHAHQQQPSLGSRPLLLSGGEPNNEDEFADSPSKASIAGQKDLKKVLQDSDSVASSASSADSAPSSDEVGEAAKLVQRK